ncbi:N-acetyl-gamma-glutamyl-phosphate reductase [Clostridium sp. 19966]|uniref:N-acetyl-gamma-glutamyl-phosphate reductase n=1 Tax=Clostridium sp. 19966 TaxID=2768166 RepID=UPI0028E015F2|nr:N-acetyl-gamma-glutamyl-phosphate reductase [Clostridium sp. 19966]MDT8715658.1 N-acetyl-gamma-glutamyl-phosphate reductase [Clostridium sp. 19966]
MFKIFVDGQYGTTGLRINEYMQKHSQVELINLDFEKRKDISARKKCLNEADVVFLCLPDAASKEAVALIENENTKVIDASTAHRTNEDWAYGIPELSKEQREKIRISKRVSVPGCHASATIMAIAPLVKAGIISADYPLNIFSITGYSGGGKQMIETYETSEEEYLKSPRPYALTLNHKHLPEIKKHSGLNNYPIFIPVVSNYYKGLAVSIPLYTNMLNKSKSPKEIAEFLSQYYEGEQFVNITQYGDDSTLIDGAYNITACNDTNNVEISVFGNEERIVLISKLDNLGKGASGAAVQNMNIMLGLDESIGLK